MKKAEHVPHSCILMQLLSNDIYIFKESDSEHAVGVNCLKDWKRNCFTFSYWVHTIYTRSIFLKSPRISIFLSFMTLN